MTTLDGRPNTALLVIDTQNAILAAADGRDGVVANIGGLAGLTVTTRARLVLVAEALATTT